MSEWQPVWLPSQEEKPTVEGTILDLLITKQPDGSRHVRMLLDSGLTLDVSFSREAWREARHHVRLGQAVRMKAPPVTYARIPGAPWPK